MLAFVKYANHRDLLSASIYSLNATGWPVNPELRG
jgi:hypothetical protein